jgi:hypothetical protein
MENRIHSNASPAARVITIAWGENYIDELLSLTLPALLAPGNLPELVKAFSCEFVLVTESMFFDRIRSAPVFRLLQTYCDARLVPVDDLVLNKGSYGLSLTYAYHRAFADLGERMTSYYLFFFNADFILADGCYRSLIVRLKAGERLVLAPSYCVTAEMVAPILQARVDRDTLTLSMRPREMAALALQHRHNTIRGKTVNQNLCHLEWIEQFYWDVDHHTLLANQLPIAIVCLRPERVYVEPVTVWDYGLISEICPNTKPCVLGDSDDFLMVELRKRATAEDQFLPGWPSVKEIAAKLEMFSTQDQREHARYQLVLHSQELPPETEGASAQLRSYVESVLAAMKPPVHHRNHFQWTYHFKLQSHHHRCNRVARQLLGLDHGAFTASVPTKGFEDIQVQPTYNSASPSWPRRLFEWVFGRYPRLNRNHAYWADFQYVVGAVDQALKGNHMRGLVVTSEKIVTSWFVEKAPAFIVSVPAQIAQKRTLHPVSDAHVMLNVIPVNARQEPQDVKPFDMCFCALDFKTLMSFSDIISNVKAAMTPGGKIIVFHVNDAHRPMTKREVSLVLGFLLTTGSSKVYFGGFTSSFIPRIARKLMRLAVGNRAKGGVRGMLIPAAAILLSVPFARLANIRFGSRQEPPTMPQYPTSVTIEIDL